jgi:hypothetical protein
MAVEAASDPGGNTACEESYRAGAQNSALYAGLTSHAGRQVVDTVLAKLLALSNKRIDLNALLSGPHDVVISEVEDILKSTAQCGALSVLYQQSGDDRKLLDMWSKYALR